MFEHVVVGTDFSPGSEVLLEWLPALGKLGAARLTLIHALGAPYTRAGLEDELREARQRLEGARPRLEAEGFEVHTAAVPAPAAEAILKVAEERKASMILVGSRSRSRLTDAFVGSVALSVIHKARVPVLVQRIDPGRSEGEAFRVGSDGFERVLFPTDWSETADRAFALVEHLTSTGIIRSVELLHVRSELQETRTGRSHLDEDLRRLEDLAERLRARGAGEVEVSDPSGSPFQEISHRAAARPGTLVVMGTHGRGAVADALMGGVSREVVKRASTPVLLVPAAR
jgi:nucleotide-binding universal stress UspA family protein